jgi:two-component system, sensor histidine kinase YesM
MDNDSRFRSRFRLRGKLKLHTILTIFISLIVLCIIAGSGRLSLYLFKTKTVESFAHSRQDTLLQISDSVTDYCKKIELLSVSYADLDYIREQAALPPEERIDLAAFRQRIDSIKQQIDASIFFSDIQYELQIIADNGLSYSSQENHLDTLLGLVDTIWFYHAKKEHVDSLWQSNILFKSGEEKTNVISFVNFIKDAEGQTSGAILINLDERQLYRIYSQIIGFQSTIYLVDTRGQIASHPTLSMVGRFFYDMKIFNAFFEEQNWAQIKKSGKNYLFSKFSSLENPWIVVEEIPMNVITDPLEHISKTIELFTGILLLISLIVAVFFSQRVSLPFEKLARSMEIAGSGDLSVPFVPTGCYESYTMAESSRNFVDRIQSLIEELKVTEREKRTSELEFLQMQINPHFMYNTLFTIRCLVDFGLKDTAREMIDRFSNMLKKVLRIDSSMVTIVDNIDYLEDYSFIMVQRFGSLSFTYEIEEGLEHEKILKFVLQPLLENSIYHGFADGVTEDSLISIAFSLFGPDFIEIHVRDNGCGMTEETLNTILDPPCSDDHSHIGLYNVKTKLQLYYEGRARLHITSEVGRGTDIQIIIPRIQNDYEDTDY